MLPPEYIELFYDPSLPWVTKAIYNGNTFPVIFDRTHTITVDNMLGVATSEITAIVKTSDVPNIGVNSPIDILENGAYQRFYILRIEPDSAGMTTLILSEDQLT